MSEEVNPLVGGIIRRTFDHIKRERGLASDRALADAIGIDPVTIWRWGQGDVGRAAQILVPLVEAAARAEACPVVST